MAADWEFDGVRSKAQNPHRGEQARTVRLIRLSGMAVSAALIIGLGIWSYKLGMRQLHGIPLIAAPEGLARVAPENPGGELADHQGLAVNTIAAVGEAEAAADLLVLAPRAAELAPEDTATDALTITLGTALAPPAPVPEPGPKVGRVEPSETMLALRPAQGQLAEPLPEGAAEPLDGPELEMATAQAVDAAVAEALGEVVAPESAPLSEAAEAGVDIIAASIPGLAQSPRPLAKPSAIGLIATVVAQKATPLPNVTELDAATLSKGSQLAQIGSYPSPEEARLAWDGVALQYSALLEGKARIIEEAQSGGRTFFRLRVAGFEDREAAERFCAALPMGGQCVPVQVH